MVTPGAGRNDIPNRLKRQFAIFHVPPPSEAAINNIFGSLMAGRFCPGTFSPEVGARGWAVCRDQNCRNGCVPSYPHRPGVGHVITSCSPGFHSCLPHLVLPWLQVADVAARLVPATMTLFNRVQARMLPTPAKFHYLFNMRDLSKASGVAGPAVCSLESLENLQPSRDCAHHLLRQTVPACVKH